jgi:RecJ-like exonuclease
MSNYPQKWEICCRCKGEGKHDHPAFANGITQSEMREMGRDGMDSYFAGHYDVRCDECDGTGKVRALDVDAMDEAQRAQWDSEGGDRRERAADLRALAREQAAERAMGC